MTGWSNPAQAIFMVKYGLVSPRIPACNLTQAIHFRCKSGKFDQNRLWITGKHQVKERKSINLDSISVCPSVCGILGFRLFPGISNMPFAPK